MSQRVGVVWSVIPVLALSILAGCGLLVDETARFERARQSYGAGDMDGAIVDLKAVLQGNPANADARLLLGDALFRTRDVAGAAKEFERGVELLREASRANEGAAPSAARQLLEATAKLAALQLTMRDFAKARVNAEALIAGSPNEVVGYVMASQAAFYAGDTAASRSYAEQLLERSADNPLGRAMLGFVAAREGGYAEAEEHFGAVLARQPNQAAVRLALTQLQIVMGKPAAAAATLAPVLVVAPTDARLHQLLDLMQIGTPEARALVGSVAGDIERANPTSPVPAVLRGRAALLAKDYETAADQFQAAIAKGGGRYPLIGYYAAQRLLGNESVAHDALEEWVASNPDDHVSGYLLASAYLDQGQNGRARAEYERILGTTEVESPLMLNNLAWLYGEVNDPRAIETARQARQLAPDNGAITDTLGWLLVKAGQHDEGIRLLRLAVQQVPDSQEIRYHLTTALAQVGERDGVQQQIDRILPGALDATRGIGSDAAGGPPR